MRIEGEWLVCEDGVRRPVVLVEVQAADSTFVSEYFLIDTGADRTVLRASLFERLGFAPSAEDGFALEGIGGHRASVRVATVLVFQCLDGTPATVNGPFVAFQDPAAADMSILGRDVLNNFDVILGRGRSEIVFLAGNHTYRIDHS